MTHRPEENYPEEVRIKLDKDQCLDVDGPESHLTFVITGMQLNKIFILYQEGLFYWNIRKFLKHGSRINKRITETIIHSPETFYYLNNGISAFCNSFEFNQNATELIIKKYGADLQLLKTIGYWESSLVLKKEYTIERMPPRELASNLRLGTY